MKSPISGLSLIVHLGVIALAVLLIALMGERRWAIFRRAFSATPGNAAHALFLQTLSVIIVLLLGIFMFAFMAIAITTGIREGAREPQIQLIQRGFEILVDSSAALATTIGSESAAFAQAHLPVNTITYARTGDIR